ncbi:MAG: alpha-amylase family protein, partial [Spirochaetes bacterium]|nr:alpha-amylase family protein [Spirochaetota bacterium]
QRLWSPPPGSGGAIASRAEHSITTDEFNARIPNEFWREVVDRCAHEAPHTLLLAEAFWMMEGYFVRTLGMHRVYNSAFMNMLKNEENDKYRATIKNTLSFDPEVLKRFVNFMNNPDEDTAVEQFGKGDKYFGICTLLVTMPGLPMFGHGQIEGFEEKYGMEYSRSYKNESEDAHLVWRHEREIFPLMKRRALFSGSEKFRIFDLYIDSDNVNENVFAYTNRVFTGAGEEKALVFFNNSYHQTAGWIKHSDPEIPEKDGGVKRDSLSEALAIHGDANYFTLLREQKSGLWFVRSSKGICENGFFVSLNGYETQVYIDIYEREDDSRGHWARLHNDLGGRGTPDPQAAIMDIFLGELYYRFAELFKPENIATLHGYFTGETPKTEEHFEAFIASLAAPLEAYMDEAEKFIKGGEGSFDAWKATDEDGREIVFTPMGKNPKGALNIMRRDFENALREFVKIAEDVPAKAAPEKTVKRIKNLTLAEVLAGEIKEKPFLCAAYLGYALFALLRGVIGWETEYRITATGRQAANLAFEHWGFGRKLAEQCKNFGASEDDARRAADFAHFVLSRTGGWRGTHIAAIDRELREMDKAFGGNFSKSIANLEKINRGGWWAAKVIENNYADEDLRRVLGVNVFEDITWFNKESFENLLFFGSLYLVAESAEVLPPLLSGSWWTKGMPEVDRSKDKRRVDTLDKTYQALVFAGEKSGWRLNALIDILAGDLSVADSQPDTPPGGK